MAVFFKDRFSCGFPRLSGWILLYLSLCFLSLICGGCGYQLGERTAELPSWIQTIYVEPWDNRSNELLLGPWMTAELRQEFLRGNSLELAPREKADVILTGKVIQVDTAGLSYTRYDTSVERRISVVCSVTLEDRHTGRILWTTSNIRREEAFWVGADAIKTEDLKNQALKKLSRDVAETIYHRISGVF